MGSEKRGVSRGVRAFPRTVGGLQDESDGPAVAHNVDFGVVVLVVQEDAVESAVSHEIAVDQR